MNGHFGAKRDDFNKTTAPCHASVNIDTVVIAKLSQVTDIHDTLTKNKANFGAVNLKRILQNFLQQRATHFPTTVFYNHKQSYAGLGSKGRRICRRFARSRKFFRTAEQRSPD